MVQILSINFFSWISSIFVGFFKSSLFFVSPCRRKGRLKGTWRGTIEDEIRSTGRSWNEVKGIAGNHNAWTLFMDALCSTRSKRIWWWWCIRQLVVISWSSILVFSNVYLVLVKFCASSRGFTLEAFECVRHWVVIFCLIDFVLMIIRWNFYYCCLSLVCFGGYEILFVNEV